MARPGIMLYFDILEPLKVLPDADKGRLFVAILEYGQTGVNPEFEGMLAMAWGFIKPKLDRDGIAYENTTAQRKYAAFCKKLKARGLEKIEFDDWMVLPDTERERLLTTVTECNPSTTVSPTTKTTLSSSTSSTPTVTAISATTGGTNPPDASADFETLRRQRMNMLQEYMPGDHTGGKT